MVIRIITIVIIIIRTLRHNLAAMDSHLIHKYVLNALSFIQIYLKIIHEDCIQIFLNV